MIKILMRLWNYIRVKNAVVHANKMASKTNKKYYVLQINKKIHVLHRTQINYLVSKGVLRKSMKEIYTLNQMAIYYTN